MKRFSYRAKDQKTGKMLKGVLQAENEHAAGKILVEQGYTPDSIKEDSGASILDRLTNRVPTKDKIIFTRQFSTLISAGLPLSDSLHTLTQQTQNKAMKSVVEDIQISVESGKSLADSFAKYPEVFDNLYVSLVRAGEASGTLDEALRRLADQQEKDAAMISKIRGAMVYPAIILVVIIAVLAFMMIEVVPEVVKLYNDMKEPLPFLTSVMVGITNFFASAWWIILIILAVAVYFFLQYKRTDSGKRLVASIKLGAPIFKGLFQRLYMNRFARTTQLLLSTGVPMLEALHIAGDATSNVLVDEQIEKAAEQVKSGKPLSKSLEDKKYMMPLVPQMASIGEQSGKIDEMLGRAAKVYETELDERIANISTMIEPILMVVMALLIGIVISSTLLPIYTLVSSI